MPQSTFKDLVSLFYKCVEKLEEEFQLDIIDSETKILQTETIDVKLPLQKVKIFHYNEIIQITSKIKIDIKKILYHIHSIKNLDETKKLTGDEIKHYTSKNRSTEDLTIIARRHKKRVSSDISLYTLSTWEAYLNQKKEEPQLGTTEMNITRRYKPQSKRKTKKIISSTFNDILDEENVNAIDNNFILEENEDIEEDIDLEKEAEIKVKVSSNLVKYIEDVDGENIENKSSQDHNIMRFDDDVSQKEDIEKENVITIDFANKFKIESVYTIMSGNIVDKSISTSVNAVMSSNMDNIVADSVINSDNDETKKKEGEEIFFNKIDFANEFKMASVYPVGNNNCADKSVSSSSSKVISSNFDDILDDDSNEDNFLNLDRCSKPRIVDIIYKKKKDV